MIDCVDGIGEASPTKLRLLSWSMIDGKVPSDHHVHTLYTDGTASVQEMADAAASRGIAELLFSEHARHDSEYFVSFARNVRALQYISLRAYVGVETKILDLDGHLDCSTQICSLCDAVIGSVHSPPSTEIGENRGWSQLDVRTAVELEYQLAMAIVSRSRAHILGHPMGMVISRFGLRPFEHLRRLARACSDFDKAFELNARYCPSPAQLIEVVRDSGCKVSFGSDAHHVSEVGNSWFLFMQGGTQS